MEPLSAQRRGSGSIPTLANFHQSQLEIMISWMPTSKKLTCLLKNLTPNPTCPIFGRKNWWIYRFETTFQVLIFHFPHTRQTNAFSSAMRSEPETRYPFACHFLDIKKNGSFFSLKEPRNQSWKHLMSKFVVRSRLTVKNVSSCALS